MIHWDKKKKKERKKRMAIRWFKRRTRVELVNAKWCVAESALDTKFIAVLHAALLLLCGSVLFFSRERESPHFSHEWGPSSELKKNQGLALTGSSYFSRFPATRPHYPHWSTAWFSDLSMGPTTPNKLV